MILIGDRKDRQLTPNYVSFVYPSAILNNVR